MASFLYEQLNGNANILLNKEMKWLADRDEKVSFVLKVALRLIYLTTNVPKYRSFQYRLLHRALITNVNLKQWGKSESDSCAFCDSNKETYRHLFYECKLVEELWQKVKSQIINTWFPNISLDWSYVNVLQDTVCNKRGHIINFICLIVKQYIYKCKCLGHVMNVNAVKSKIFEIRNMEKFYATKNNLLSKYNVKWRGIQ